MEEEEARLKALLEQTEDFDERRKIRAELRVVRKKMLDALSANAEAESNERATRRAERARARKAEEEASNHIGPAITDKLLSEIDDEVTLQTLLNEIPTSQIDDRRRIRARIREVKRKKTEEEEPTPRRTRRTRETTETSEEPIRNTRRYQKTASDDSIETKQEEPSTTNDISHVSITTTSDDAPCITIETTSEEQSVVSIQTKIEEPSNEPPDESANELSNEPTTELANEVSNEPANEPANELSNEPTAELTNEVSNEPANEAPDQPCDTIETNSDEPFGISVKMSSDDPKAVTIETTTANHADDDNEIKFKLTLRQTKDIQLEQDREDVIDESADLEIDQAVEVPNDVPVETPVEIRIEHSVDENHDEQVEDADSADDTPEVLKDETQDEENGEVEAAGLTKVGEGISLEIKIDGEVDLSFDDEKGEEQPSQDSQEQDTADGGNISKDENNASSEKTKPRWPAQNDEKKKPGRANQVDFRNNLKKSGKIGPGKVNLEKKNNTTGAQVDFRNLKKSGRIGTGNVNLENKISTHGAQVDFRSGNLKPSGKIGIGSVNLERKPNTAGAQVDFRTALKKGGSSQTPAGSARKSSLKSEATKESQKPEEKQQPTEQPPKAEQPPKIEQPSEAKVPEQKQSETSSQDNPPAAIKVTIPPPVKKKAPVKEPKLVPAKNEKARNETTRNEAKVTRTESKTVQNEPEPTQNGPTPTDEDISEDKDGDEIPAKVDVKLDVKIDNVAASVNHGSPAPKEVPEAKEKTKYKPRDSYKTRDDTTKTTGGKNKLFEKMSKFQAKDETVVKPKGYTPRSGQKKEPTPADKAVNGLAVKVENTSITAKEPESPVEIEVTEHVETEVKEETKQDGDVVEEKKEVTTTTKTTTPSGAKIQTKETKTTTKKTFLDPEIQKRMAQRQRDRVMAKREQASSAKNKRMAFMQKLEANSPAEKAPSNIKRSGSNVDKLLAWCRFKLREYEGVKLTNFSSSWADGLAFCALIHLYLPEKIPYEELLAGGDKRRNFETAFSAATEAGVPELLEVDDMLSVSNPEPKSVMTYVSSIYKHFNPS